MPYANTGEWRLYFEEHGAGEPIVFVSGFRGLASHWRHLVPMFQKRFRVIVHDQLGTGKSDHPNIRYSVDQMAQNLLCLLDQLGIQRAHLVGHSTGGVIAQVIALDNPQRLFSLSLLSSWPKADTYFRLAFALRKDLLTQFGQEVSERYWSLFVNPPWWINQHSNPNAQTEIASQPPLAVTLSRIDAILAFDRSNELHRISTPTVVMCSRDDQLTPFYFSEALAAAIPGAHLVALEDAGHLCHQTRPQDVAHHLGTFIDSLCPQ